MSRVKRASQHMQHYLPLIGILVAGVFGFMAFSYDKIFQAAIVLALAASYFAWGVIHHHLHRDLHLSVVLEYFAISALGIVIVFSLLFRA